MDIIEKMEIMPLRKFLFKNPRSYTGDLVINKLWDQTKTGRNLLYSVIVLKEDLNKWQRDDLIKLLEEYENYSNCNITLKIIKYKEVK